MPALLFALWIILSPTVGACQRPVDSLAGQVDVNDVFRQLFHKKQVPDSSKKATALSILPSAGYNPSIGLQIGVTSTGGQTLGNPATTTFSVFNWNAYVSTKKLASFELKHNVFTADNALNLQGGLQVGRKVAFDYGIGTGRMKQSDGSFSFNNIPFENNPDVFPITYTYIRFNERVYRKLFRYVYAGAGLAVNWYTNIDNQRTDVDVTRTHNYRYSIRNGYNPENYVTSGLLFNLQYNSRDQPNRPYKGIYADVVLRVNQKWMGSNKEALQIKTELRKYWSLSRKNPEHILGFWFWGNYLLHGSVPYLELPGTGSDAAERIGRAYTIGRFKGLSFVYMEGEYRFPLTHNKLLSGVLFANTETANNKRNAKLYEYWEPGLGGGLRLLFNKNSRSNLCIDYGRGNYGSNGVFLGLNEVF